MSDEKMSDLSAFVWKRKMLCSLVLTGVNRRTLALTICSLDEQQEELAPNPRFIIKGPEKVLDFLEKREGKFEVDGVSIPVLSTKDFLIISLDHTWIHPKIKKEDDLSTSCGRFAQVLRDIQRKVICADYVLHTWVDGNVALAMFPNNHPWRLEHMPEKLKPELDPLYPLFPRDAFAEQPS